MSVKCVRLTNGEEIIAEVSELPDGKIGLRKPANIFLQPDNQGNVKVALMPLFPYAEKPEFVFPSSIVVTIFPPSNALYNEYNRAFGSGLVIPTIDLDKKQLITG